MALGILAADAIAVGGYLGFQKRKKTLAKRRQSLLGYTAKKNLKELPVVDAHLQRMTASASAADRRAAAALTAFMRRIVSYQAFDLIMVNVAQKLLGSWRKDPKTRTYVALAERGLARWRK